MTPTAVDRQIASRARSAPGAPSTPVPVPPGANPTAPSPPPPSSTTVAPVPHAPARPVRRFVYGSLGVLCVGVGAVGVVVPGLPTTIWLLAASYLFARSNPRLEARLIRNRFFGPYLRYLDRPATMPRRAKITACALMWASACTSLALLAAGNRLPLWLAAVIVVAALVGTFFVWRFGRDADPAADSAA